MKFSENEKILHDIKPEQKLIAIWFFTKCLTHGLATAFIPMMVWWFYATFANLSKVIIFEEYSFFIKMGLLLLGIGISISYLYNRALINTISYYVTDRKCVWSGGILRKVEHSVSYHKITDIERSQNLIEQILKLSTASLFTPGTSSMGAGLGARAKTMPELMFEGLAPEVSSQVSETINENVRKYGNPQP